VLTSEHLNESSGAQLFFKCENFQKTGSFKIRGATNAILSLTDDQARNGVMTHSSGNHGAALARAAQLRGIPAWIVMPSNAPATKHAAVRSYGGQVAVCEPTLEARETTAREISDKTQAYMVHPYDNVQIIAGQGTVALEFLDEVPDLDYILAPVSGGGLLSGISLAAKLQRPQIKVIGCEPANADDAYRSLRSGAIAPAGSGDTIADGLRATLSPLTFSILKKYVDDIVTVTEAEIVDAMKIVWERMKIIVEPSSAVAAAPAISNKIGAAGKKVGIVLSGGNLDLTRLPFQA
jgi:threonine dehydratase